MVVFDCYVSLPEGKFQVEIWHARVLVRQDVIVVKERLMLVPILTLENVRSSYYWPFPQPHNSKVYPEFIAQHFAAFWKHHVLFILIPSCRFLVDEHKF